MSFTFRPARRENVHVIIGLAGGTGSGKTYSAMRLATGLAGGQRFAVIDTEAGRAKHYADQFTFDHGDLTPPFRPQAYLDAIVAAEEAGYPVIVVDSMSHEHAGEGGLLDWHEEILTAKIARKVQSGDNRPEWQIREPLKMTAWIDPKMAHKKMINRLLQLRAHLILCFRAEPKIRMEKNSRGKTEIQDDGWHPVAAKGIMFEVIASMLLTHEQPGVPEPIKLEAQHRPAFPPGRAITEEAGAALLAWSRGSQESSAGPSGLDLAIETIESAHTKDELREVYRRLPNMVGGDDLATARARCKERSASAEGE